MNPEISILQKNKIDKKIVYFTTVWTAGTAYKDYHLMKENFGGTIVEDNKKILIETKPDIVFCFGDARKAYRKPLECKLPYVLIEQDIYSMRCGLTELTEKHDREKIENASAVIFTSREHAEYYERMKRKYGWKIPYYDVIYTRPLKKDLDFVPRKKMDGLNLVYAGGIVPWWDKRKGFFGYRCYHEIFKRFIKAGWGVHIYSQSRLGNLREYRDIGCITHEKLPYGKLLREMSQYTAGLHSYNKIDTLKLSYEYTQACRPNKIWDYLAAGIPTIGYQGGRGMKIYKGKWGIIIDDIEIKTLEELPKRLEKIKISNQMRYGNVIDRDIGKFRRAIEEALKANKSKKYIVPKSVPKLISKVPFPKFISVENRGKIIIERANHIFYPDKKTEVFQVDESAFRLIKAHVHLKINIKE